MERSKGLILIVVGLAAALIVWQVGFNKTETPTPSPDNKNISQTPRNRQQELLQHKILHELAGSHLTHKIKTRQMQLQHLLIEIRDVLTTQAEAEPHR